MERLLENVRVVDLTRMLSGPYCSMIMADMGAEVIKIEDPQEGGDPMRMMTPRLENGMSAYFFAINRNKKSVALDLKKPAAKALFNRLVEKSDVILDNFRPGVLAKLGADYQAVRHYNSRIISCSITGFGDDGPYAQYPAFDLIFQAYSGAMSITGEPGGAPVRLGLPMGDLSGAMLAVGAISSALYRREKTGEGGRVAVSLLDGLVSNLCYMAQYYWTDGQIPERIGSGHQSVVPYQAFKTADSYVVAAVFVDRFWKDFCTALGLPDLINHPHYKTNALRSENRSALIPLIEKRFLEKNAKQWLDLLQKAGVPCAPINTIDKVLSDPQVIHNNMVVEIDLPESASVKALGNVIKADGAKDIFTPPPHLGQDTEAVCRHILSCSDEEIALLKESSTI